MDSEPRMPDREPVSNTPPQFSIIIAAYDDWGPLDQCLGSLAQQGGAPSFEAIVVDDGSRETAPEFIQQWADHYPLTIVRQPHSGIPAARNHGVQISKGATLVFIDADCKFEANSLAALASAVTRFPQHGCFQLRIVGDRSRYVGRAEHLRLTTFQRHVLQADGRIRFLNTAGFAIRRSKVDIERGLFNLVALRGEDTLLLADLIQRGELPFYVPDATVQHVITLSLMGCLLKDVRSGYLEATAYDIIASEGIRIRTTQRERLSMMRSMWKASRENGIGRLAWFVLMVRHSLHRAVSIACRWLRIRPSSHPTPP